MVCDFDKETVSGVKWTSFFKNLYYNIEELQNIYCSSSHIFFFEDTACNINLPKVFDRKVLQNSEDPDQTPQNAASDQGPHCLPVIQQF